MKHKLRLSQCMIVKNEEANIERALSWGKGIVCEQIVVDTGSTDNTVELAKKMGAKVFHFDWVDDFSAAKNYAIEQATGRWIAFLDADEYFNSKDTRKLLHILKEIETKHPITEWPHSIRTTLANLNDEGCPTSTMAQDRIFRNIPTLRYMNRIHEVLYLKDGRDLRIADGRQVLSIYHTGYSSSAYSKNDKARRNIALLQQELKERPDDYGLMSYLGDAYIVESDFDKARAIFKKIIEEAPGKPDVAQYTIENSCDQFMKFLITKPGVTVEEVDYWYQKCIEAAPELPDIDYWYATWMMNREKWKETFHYMQKAVDKVEKYQGIIVLNITGDLKRVYCILSRAAQETHQEAQAVKYMVLALRMNRYEESVLVALLDLLRREPSEAAEASGTFSLIKSLYRLEELKDKLFVLKCTKLAQFPQMERRVFELFTEEEREGLL